MNKKFAASLALSLLIGLLFGRYAFNSGQPLEHSLTASPLSAQSSPSLWTCSMHPQIQQPDPGSCPICGMDLIPVTLDLHSDLGPTEFRMSESSRALAEIQTSSVQKVFPEAQIRLVGKLEYDETRLKSLTARFPARIDQLYVNYTGIKVNKGDHLAVVYSPELLATQQELLNAYRSNPNSSITQTIREKLRLWDLLPDQINEIIRRGSATDNFVLKAPIGGIVVAKQVNEGDYIKTGEPLFKIADLSHLWLNLDAYESDLTWLHYGQEVTFSVESYPGEVFNGQIAFINQEVDRNTRTIGVRVNVPNTNYRLKPGMFSRGIVSVKIAAGGKVFLPQLAGKWISPMHPEIIKDAPGTCDICGMDLVSAEDLGYVENAEKEAPLIVPASAVLRTGKRAIVYIEKSNTTRPTFEGREIVLGPRAGDVFIVLSGLQVGDRVVTNGAFKIDSALQIQAKPSMMNPQANQDSSDLSPKSNPLISSVQIASDILPAYLKMQSALTVDNLDAAQAQARAISAISRPHSALADLSLQLSNALSLDSFRKPLFENLSNALITSFKDNPNSVPKNLYTMFCPMVYPDRGALWLQDSNHLRNPYFGPAMLNCGEIKEHLRGSHSPNTHSKTTPSAEDI